MINPSKPVAALRFQTGTYKCRSKYKVHVYVPVDQTKWSGGPGVRPPPRTPPRCLPPPLLGSAFVAPCLCRWSILTPDHHRLFIIYDGRSAQAKPTWLCVSYRLMICKMSIPSRMLITFMVIQSFSVLKQKQTRSVVVKLQWFTQKQVFSSVQFFNYLLILI